VLKASTGRHDRARRDTSPAARLELDTSCAAKDCLRSSSGRSLIRRKIGSCAMANSSRQLSRTSPSKGPGCDELALHPTAQRSVQRADDLRHDVAASGFLSRVHCQRSAFLPRPPALVGNTDGNLSAAAIGSSTGRNTPYFLLCEDDFTLRNTRDRRPVAVLRYDDQIGSRGCVGRPGSPRWIVADFARPFRGSFTFSPAQSVEVHAQSIPYSRAIAHGTLGLCEPRPQGRSAGTRPGDL